MVSVSNDAQWKALADVLRTPQLNSDPSLSSAAGRRAQREKIDTEITDWTLQRSADEAMRVLQMAGVSAGVARPVWGVLEDPHLRSRGFFKKVHREYLGEYLATTPWFRETERPVEISRLAPTLGEHSREVLSRVIGLAEEQVFALEKSGITGTVATKKVT